MKYWNSRRIQRIRDRTKRRENAAAADAIAIKGKQQRYSAGDTEKNSGLMLDALGLPLRRKLLKRLQKEGAMSLSKLAEPFRMKLPTLHRQVLILERAGLVATHKRGRVRMCIYNRAAFVELATWLTFQG